MSRAELGGYRTCAPSAADALRISVERSRLAREVFLHKLAVCRPSRRAHRARGLGRPQ
eukprot:CAMPEP_0176013970 /NCGR_PEP_ID=MMETSP0120_2-20121206/6580_1 /TAXON_ID=160619 /ORGANISM="Kryptoperidinium foliaceum, Strain CCMP 1326" /LENGTH=57 /DNA_ID=CAMNT_0017346893 /DNA_START=38 /DNA_END=211 /DNA_ORIENTATION=-